MILKCTRDIADNMGIRLTHASILDNSTFNNCNRKSLKIVLNGKLALVPFTPEELMGSAVGEDLKKQIMNTLSHKSISSS